ncbi:MAG: hypothetical protein WB772_15605, partial [Xanthobacteraceae bacterium]
MRRGALPRSAGGGIIDPVKRSSDHIRTSHAGRLPVPPGCEDMPFRLFRGETVDPKAVETGIDHVVRKQLDLGIDCIGDGEFWKARNFAYFSRHFTGIEMRPLKTGEPASTRVFTRERDEFAQFYKDLDATGTIFHIPGEKPMPPDRTRAIASGPIKIKSLDALKQEIETFKAAVARTGRAVDETFFCVLAPGWLDHFIYNEHYKTDEEYLFALAEVLREEYRTVVNSGFI